MVEFKRKLAWKVWKEELRADDLIDDGS